MLVFNFVLELKSKSPLTLSIYGHLIQSPLAVPLKESPRGLDTSIAFNCSLHEVFYRFFRDLLSFQSFPCIWTNFESFSSVMIFDVAI